MLSSGLAAGGFFGDVASRELRVASCELHVKLHVELQVASCKLGDAAPSMVKRKKFGIAEEKQRTFVASEFSFLNGRGKQRNRVGLECRRDFLTAVINRAFSECLLTTVSNCY